MMNLFAYLDNHPLEFLIAVALLLFGLSIAREVTRGRDSRRPSSARRSRHQQHAGK